MRRIWMLLLVTVALLAVMAIPAMAAECCGDAGHCSVCCDGNHEGWNKITSATTGISASGNYYIATEEGVALEKSFIISKAGIEVTICLNGREWKGAANADGNRTRPLSVTETLTVNIVDCSKIGENGISQGKVYGSDLTWRDENSNMSRGGNLYVIKSGQLNIYNGTYYGGNAFSGGNVYVSGTAKISVYGGRLEGGETTTYTLDGAAAESLGGNIFVDEKAEFYISDATIAGGKVGGTTASATCLGPALYLKGKFTAQNATITSYIGETRHSEGHNGGLITIYGANAEFSAEGTTIVGGKSTNAGAAIRVTAAKKVQITGGTITGGDTKTGAAIHGGGAAEITLSGVRVQPGVTSYSAGVSGSYGLIYITNSGAKLTLENNTVVDASQIVKVANGAAIGITAAATVNLSGSTIYAGPATSGPAIYMTHGTVNVTDGSTISIHENTSIPNTTHGLINVNGASAVFKMNGGSINATKMTCTTGGTALVVKLGSAELTKVAVYGGTAPRAVTIQTTDGAGSLKIEDCDIHPGESTSTVTGGAALGFADGEITMKNSRVHGHQTNEEGEVEYLGTAVFNGGAIYVNGAADLTIDGGIIYGGSAGNFGGAIFMTGTDACITLQNNAQVSGGAAAHGGAVYVESGTFTATGSTITGGTATNGGLVYMAGGTFSMSGGTLTKGKAVGDKDNETGNGGAIFMSGGSVSLTNGVTVSDSTAHMGGLVCIDGESAQFTSNGTTFTNGFSTKGGAGIRVRKAAENGVSITGGEISNNETGPSTGGSALIIFEADVTLNNVRVVGKKDLEDTYGIIYLSDAAASLTMEGGEVDASLVTKINYGAAIDVAKGELTLNATTVIGGEAQTGGAIYIADGKATITGGELSNGTATQGGLVCINAANGELAATGTSFSNGVSTNAGGAIRANTAKSVSLTDCEIACGNSKTGAALYINTASVVLDKVEITAFEGTDGTNGLIYLNNAAASLTMKNNTVIDARGAKFTTGPAIQVANGTVVMENTTIYGGTGTNGGAINLTNGSFTMKSGTVYGGYAYTGGCLRLVSGTFNFYGGKLTGGRATVGGNVFVSMSSGKTVCAFNAIPDPEGEPEGTTRIIENGSADYDVADNTSGGNISLKVGTMVLDGVQVYGGMVDETKQDKGSNIYVEGGELTIKGATTIAGGLDVNNAADKPLVLEGTPVIDKALTAEGKEVPDASLKLLGSSLVQINTLAEGASIKVTCADPTVAFSNAADSVEAAETWAARFTAEQTGYVVSVNDDNKLCLITLDGAAKVNNKLYYSLAKALQRAGGNGLVQMLDDYTGNVTVPAGLYLDLNGKVLTGNVTVTEGTLHLIDDANAGYTYEGGKVTGTITGDGSLADVFTTGSQAHYGHNYRFLVLKTDAGYSAHRIYLAVKSTVFSPKRAAVNFVTVFKCDELLAQYVDAYGAQIAAENAESTNYLEGGATLATGNDNTNQRTTQLTNMLHSDMGYEELKNRTEATLQANAYITLKKNAGGATIVSTTVSKTFRSIVEQVDQMDVTAAQQTYLADMYAAYAQAKDANEAMQDLMATWNIPTIKTYAPSAKEEQ